jgi:hypothetical protein
MKNGDASARSTIFTVVPDGDENIQASNGLITRLAEQAHR